MLGDPQRIEAKLLNRRSELPHRDRVLRGENRDAEFHPLNPDRAPRCSAARAYAVRWSVQPPLSAVFGNDARGLIAAPGRLPVEPDSRRSSTRINATTTCGSRC